MSLPAYSCLSLILLFLEIVYVLDALQLPYSPAKVTVFPQPHSTPNFETSFPGFLANFLSLNLDTKSFFHLSSTPSLTCFWQNVHRTAHTIQCFVATSRGMRWCWLGIRSVQIYFVILRLHIFSSIKSVDSSFCVQNLSH